MKVPEQNTKISIFNGQAFIDKPDKVLGQKEIVSTRFGKKAVNYKGGLELLDKINISQASANQVNAGQKINGQKLLSDSEKIMVSDVSSGQIADQSLSNIQKAIETSEKQIAEKTIQKVKSQEDTFYEAPDQDENLLSFSQVFNYTNPDGTKVNKITKPELQAFIYYQIKQGRKISAKWMELAEFSLAMANSEPVINNLVLASALFYENGQLYPKYIYLSGDINSKVQILENYDKEHILKKYGQQVYDKQHELLNEQFGQMQKAKLTIIPAAYDESGQPVNKLILKPISQFSRKFFVNNLVDEKPFKVVKSQKFGKKGEPDFDAKKNNRGDWYRDEFEKLNLQDAFIYWLKFYSSEIKFKKSGMNWQTIRDFYLKKKDYYDKRDGTKADYKRKCANCQAEGERLFDIFLQKWITSYAREQIEKQWNNQYFGVKQIDYDLVPFAFTCAKYELDGSPVDFRFEKRDAVAFAFAEGSGLLAYQVGTGKTRSAIFSIAQFMDAGFCKRPFIVVPNQTYKQWIAEINHLLPQYKVNNLFNLSKDYVNELRGQGGYVFRASGLPIDKELIWTDGDGRKMYGKNKLESDRLEDIAVFNDIRAVEPYTITILTYEGFKLIGFNDWTANDIKYDLFDILEQGEMTEKQAETKKANISADIGKALEGRKVNIEDLGFDFMVIDEAHSAKKVFTRIKGEAKSDTSENRTSGRERSQYAIESGKRSVMALKSFCIAHYIQKQNEGNNVLLLTATPFTNSPLEVYSMLSLVSFHKLKNSALSSLHEFFNQYVQVENQLVINSKLQPERKDVFVGFNNLPSLQALIARFMIYKEGGSPDAKGRIIKMKRPNKYVLPLKYDPKSEVKALLPADEQIKTNIALSPLQKMIMSRIKSYVEGELPIEEFEKEVAELANNLGVNVSSKKIKATQKDDVIELSEKYIYTEKELIEKTIEQLIDIAKNEYKIYSERLAGIGKKELIEFMMDNELSLSVDDNDFDLVDKDAITLSDYDMDEKEKAGVRVLRGVNYARSLSLSPYLFFETVLKEKGGSINIDYKSFVETSPKLTYTMECVRSVKEYHEAKGEPVSGQIIYADRGKDHFHLLQEYLVKEIGYKPHEIVIIKSGSDKETLKNMFLGQYYDEAKQKYENIPDEKRAKIVIGSSSIQEGINLQRYTSCLYNLFLPWNPTAIIQLEGRAWRQGNVFKDVRIIVPLMDDSMDIFMFQKLEEKAGRINQIWNMDGKTSIIRLEEFNPIELKKELISNPEVLAKLEIETEEERIDDDLQDMSNSIAIAERVNKLVAILTPDYYSYKKIVDIVKKYRGEKEYTTDALFRNYKNIISTQKDQNDIAIRSTSYDYRFDVGPNGITELSEFKNLESAQRALKTLEKDFLAPNNIVATESSIKKFIEFKTSEKNELEKYKESLSAEENLKSIVDRIIQEREKENYSEATAIDRVFEFKKLNNLLSNREFDKDIDKFTKLDQDIDMPPRDKDGNLKIDRESIDRLEAYLKELPQTKAIHTVGGSDTYTLERTKLHDKIIDEMREGAVCVKREQPIAILTGGLPGSGKSTFLKQYAEYLTSDKIFAIDADEVRAKLPEYKGWNADQTHKETSDIVNKLLDGCKDGIPCQYDVLYDGTMNKAKNYIPLIKKIKSLGYKIFIIFLQISPEVTRERVLLRYKRSGRYVPRVVIEEGIKNGLSGFDELKTMVDGYMLVDGETREIMEKNGEQIPIDRDYFREQNQSEDVLKFVPEEEEKAPKGKKIVLKAKAKTEPLDASEKIQSKIEIFRMMLEMADNDAEKEKIQNKIEIFEMMLEMDAA
jgi:predicted ABC-type ATPase